jgi:hypothetical protein
MRRIVAGPKLGRFSFQLGDIELQCFSRIG